MAGDLPEAAMVVGEDEALIADHFRRATATEKHHRILYAPLVDAVDVLGGDQHAGGAHIALDALEQRGQPHAFVRLQQ